MGKESDQSAETRVLIEKSIIGDERAFKKLYDMIAGKMYSLCLRQTDNTQDANDIFQSAFTRLFLNLKSFRYEGSFEGWARRVFVNTCLDFYKKKNIHFIESNEDLPSEANGFTGFDKLALEDLFSLVKKLPHGQRTVFNLYLVEGYDHKEIAEMLQISESGSKAQLHRAKNQLKKLLADEQQ
ncbi:MAG: RNA polymerase sigma factor [Chitinophagaceae bacterium]|nr:RNA polymerase sigma factor [Chitinophagaceae bacterium]